MSGKSLTHDPTIAKIVERQMRNWELARSQHLTVEKTRPQEVHDFVSISRQVGASGSTVAAALADLLGWPIFDKEILRVMAGDDEIRHRLYSSLDERDIGWFEQTIRAFADPDFGRNDYFHKLLHTVLFIIRQSPAVFLGRGVDLMLPRSAGLRVRLVAPLYIRLRNFMERSGLPEDRASHEMTKIESQRAEFARRYFGADPDDPQRYDLIVNMGRFQPPEAAKLILAAHGRSVAAKAGPGRGPASGRTS